MIKPLLKVVGNTYAPWVTDCFYQSNCTERGIEFEFLDRTLRILGYRNFKYLKAETNFERIDMLRNGTADISINSDKLSDAIKQTDQLAMTVTICQDKLIYWIKDSEAGNASLLFNVCDWKVWLLVAALVISVFSLRVICKFNELPTSFGLQLSYFTTKGTNYVWWLVLGIFLGVYANLLAIALSIPPKVKLPFTDLEDLSQKLQSGKCRIVVAGSKKDILPGTGVLSTVVPTEDSFVPPGIKMRLMEAYRTNPPKFVDSHAGMVDDIRSKDCYIGIDFYLGHPLMQAQFCGVQWIEDEHAIQESYVILFRKELMETLGSEIESLLGTGSSSDIYSRTVTRTAMRQATGCSSENQNHPLGLSELYEIFSMLSVAALVGMILCIKEIIFFHYFNTSIRSN